MTLCALGFAAEFADDGIASNTLWPRTLIATAAVQNLLGGDEAMARARRPGLYSDADAPAGELEFRLRWRHVPGWRPVRRHRRIPH